MTVVIASGGFDPLHYGHVKYLKEARKLGDGLIVIVNGNSFLIRKKGYYCLDLAERGDILVSFGFVDAVYEFNSDVDDVCDAIRNLHADKMDTGKKFEFVFAKGGDRVPGNVPEEDVCKELGIEIVYGVGGYDKYNSSSDIVENAIRMKQENGR